MKKRAVKLFAFVVAFDFALTVLVNCIISLYADVSISEQYSVFADKINKTVQGIHSTDLISPPGLENEEMLNEMQFFLNGYVGLPVFTAQSFGVYNKSTGELVCENNSEIFAIETDRSGADEGEAGYRCFCRVLNRDEIIPVMEKNAIGGDTVLKVNSIARKGLECYITEAELEYGDGKTEKFTFDADAPGFEAVTKTDDINILSPVGSTPELLGLTGVLKTKYETLSASNNAYYNSAKGRLSASKSVEKEKDIQYFFFSGNTDSHISYAQSLFGSDGLEYRLVAVYTFNVREYLLAVVLAFYAATVIAAFTAFAIAEKARSKKEKCASRQEGVTL